uniref:HDC16138 n=1 Tax=Drosophila melanogaster TaxID=7227 RepID=Q6IJ15_DROME|nr:TPA_inf: HDC16138 [Drosophila melanogaster]
MRVTVMATWLGRHYSPDSGPSQTLRQAKANGSRKLYGTCGGRGGCDGDGVCTTGNGDANEASGGTFSRPVNDVAIASLVAGFSFLQVDPTSRFLPTSSTNLPHCAELFQLAALRCALTMEFRCRQLSGRRGSEVEEHGVPGDIHSVERIWQAARLSVCRAN